MNGTIKIVVEVVITGDATDGDVLCAIRRTRGVSSAEVVGRESPCRPSRPRHPEFDALAKLDCPNLAELTRPAAGRVAKALQEIGRVCPSVTPDEIERRAAAYREHMPHATLTSTALAAHWGRCAAPPAPRVRPDNTPHWRLIQDLQRKIDTHPANPRWVGYIREDVTPEQAAELGNLREHMGNLTMDGASRS